MLVALVYGEKKTSKCSKYRYSFLAEQFKKKKSLKNNLSNNTNEIRFLKISNVLKGGLILEVIFTLSAIYLGVLSPWFHARALRNMC